MIEAGESRAEYAKRLFMSGYNCAQSVVGAFADLMAVDFDSLMRLCSGLGGGIGRLRETCGAFIGGVMVLNALYGSADPADHGAKSAQYGRVQRLAALCREKNGAIVCRELLGLPAGASSPTPERRTADYYRKRPCPQIIARTAEAVEAVILSEKSANFEKS